MKPREGERITNGVRLPVDGGAFGPYDSAVLRHRQRLGKYRIVRRIGSGGFANVYHAQDTIEGIPVALKIPHTKLVTPDMLDGFRAEARITAPLDHPNIVAIKNASFVDDHFVIVTPLAQMTLAERMKKRMSLKVALDFVEQILEGLAYAHRRGIIHCDVKPENLLLFSENRLRLTDFGIAKVALRTIKASGSGTVGYIAPEQAMGRPSPRSDVFSVGLVAYRLFSGKLPDWPYDWPAPGFDRLQRTTHADFIQLLRRSLEVNQRKRYDDASQMLAAFKKIRSRALVGSSTRRTARGTSRGADWQTVRLNQFRREWGRQIGADHPCERCGLAVSEPMRFCPWCQNKRAVHKSTTEFPASCTRCHRGIKLDWTYCPWCYGGKIGPASAREYTDRRYEGRCRNSSCKRKDLMPFMLYCPWCNRKTDKKWAISENKERCRKCGCGVLSEYWTGCPWCGTAI